MNCCDGTCNQGRDCPAQKYKENSLVDWIVKFFAVIGIYTLVMFLLGYAYASISL
jgi:hypothetical protein